MTTSTAPIHPRTGEPITVDSLNEASQGHLPGLVGLEVTDLDLDGRTVAGRIEVRQDHLAPNGFLHAATVIALADTICGYGSMAFRAAGAIGFTTIELKSNFVGTATSGAIRARGAMLHGGRSTQVWEATVEDESTGQPIAFFRCTQMMLYPRPNGTGS
jgi:uncharacterized protein (TIGR00369 family)